MMQIELDAFFDLASIARKQTGRRSLGAWIALATQDILCPVGRLTTAATCCVRLGLASRRIGFDRAFFHLRRPPWSRLTLAELPENPAELVVPPRIIYSETPALDVDFREGFPRRLSLAKPASRFEIEFKFMKQQGRSEGLRALAGCLLGGVLGIVAALAIAVIDAPAVDPTDPLEYEWYAPVALFVLPFLASILGATLGALVGAAWEFVGRKPASRGAAGLFLGLAVGELLPAHGEMIQLLRHLFLTAACTCGTLFFTSTSVKGRLLQCDETGDETATTMP